ncbi:MAG: 3-hydroxyacyl-CoA dehydrogenase NAD-binding domain-containing protein [Bacteroidota bacterium]|nr:3-hydroxyacyl-CoA dehydrogenase NAD-binding domain-containing protein [Bacteroidota bacterium]MDP4215550.1 3-hydroxyacyl-CoA dehydrogenase NAD-binding domain-containing protein [Bacteroidota bacterium]MDP4245180.1 3-hydroxyacyl-CoA dehydrogenase NAD-binding domain-containing protein [Bacteroidota bacterium]MDP4253873.1 3-hydroxyacyl-CoA dehydrogenase NAD-binding domain-containing protein [Bacteroidota bacterium]MDP4258234.1 3-hydroxyacyl-CoA dehydrogenase NAD-binding domain-containing protei
MTIRTICICGAGTMGSGIAQTAAMGGFHTLLYDVSDAVLQKAGASIEKNLQALVDKTKISATERQTVLGRLQFVTDPARCVADLIIEAIVEDQDAKLALFRQLAGFNREDTLLATNTSSLSVTALAKKLPRPERVAGMHFFNPAPLMRLVEVVRTEYTGEQTVECLLALARSMGKTPVLCKDAPGFIVNHVARPYYLEALRLMEEGFGDPETIDAIMESMGFKMGPFRLMDLIGNDVNYAVSCSVYEAMGRPERLAPSPIQEEKVRTGALGRKTGRGYYTYPQYLP